MKPFNLSLIIILAIISVGQIRCSHNPKTLKVLSEDMEFNPRTIGVVSGRYAPKIQLREPMDKATGALSGAGASTVLLLNVAGSMGQGGILLLPFIPVAAVGGAIAGRVAGVSSEKVEEAKASIETAIRNLKVQEILENQTRENLQGKTPYPVIRLEGVGPASPGEMVSYRSLSGSRPDTILEIAVNSCNLEGTGFVPSSGVSHVNSFLWLSLDTRVRLIRVADDKAFFDRTFTTRCYGQRLKFLEWGANDAALLKQEIKRCIPLVRDRITKDFMAPIRNLTGKWEFLHQICSVDGCEISGNFIIHNAGNLDAQAPLVRFYLSEDAAYHEGKDTLLREVTTKIIESGESQPIRFDYRLSTGQDIRGKYIISVIDEENTIAETDKQNNSVFRRIE